MRRRRLLASLGVSAATVAAGCLGDDSPAGERAPASDGSTPEGELSAADGETSGESGDCSCPPYVTDRERTVCSHTVDESSASVFLVPDPETAGLEGGEPAEPVTLTLHNRSSGELRFDPNSWSIRQDSGVGWTELEPEVSGDGVVTVSAGERYTWTFLEAVESIRPEPALEPGRYAAEIGVPDPSGGGWLACIALLRLESG